MSDLMMCKFRKRMVIHDTKCPSWDQVSWNNTNPTQPLLPAQMIWWCMLLIHLKWTKSVKHVCTHSCSANAQMLHVHSLHSMGMLHSCWKQLLDDGHGLFWVEFCVLHYLMIFWFKYDFEQKYHAPHVRPDRGSNLRLPDHDYISCHWDACCNHSAISDSLLVSVRKFGVKYDQTIFYVCKSPHLAPGH